jgi:hypothetical protein
MNLIYRNKDQEAYAVMAMEFLTGFAAGGEEEGCLAVEAFAEQYPNLVLDNLGSDVYGYTNPDYTAEDLCP